LYGNNQAGGRRNNLFAANVHCAGRMPIPTRNHPAVFCVKGPLLSHPRRRAFPFLPCAPLTRVGEIETRIAVHDTATPGSPPFSAMDTTALAGDLRAVWSAPTTDARLKKPHRAHRHPRGGRHIDDAASEVVLLIHWIGRVHIELRLPKRRRGQRNSTSGGPGS
jgi:hypothetical protein